MTRQIAAIAITRVRLIKEAELTTLAVLQPGYLPWLGYFDQIRRADVFIHYDDVPFDKQGWRNRNRVKGLSGPIWLTVPVLHSGKFGQLIGDVKIDSSKNWQRKHLETIKQMYASAPFLDRWLPELSDIVDRPWQLLVDLDLAVVDFVLGSLGIETRIYRSSELRIGGDKNERLLNFCRHFGADRYLTGDAANSYLDVELFARNGIDVQWHGYRHPVYPQLHGQFISHLSIIDLLFNTGELALAVLSSGPEESEKRGEGCS